MYTTYENLNNPHVTIHCTGCSQIKKRGGEHTSGKGEYLDHSNYDDARKYAESTNLKVIDCSFCEPPKCG